MASNIKDGSSYLDGIPVKISPKVLPPRNVIIPTAIDTTLSADLFLFQYDFSLERSVIENTQIRLSEIQAAKLKPAQKSSEEASSAGGEENPSESRRAAPQLVRPWQSDTILQPKPQQSLSGRSSESDIKTNDAKINLSDFENDMSSPFDYMELQTINDLEELSSVFQGIQSEELSSGQSSQPPQPTVDVEPPPESAETPIQTDTNTGVAKSVSFPLPQNSWHPPPSKQLPNSFSENFAGGARSKTSNPSSGGPWSASNYGAVPRTLDSYTVPKSLCCDSIHYPSLSQVPYISSSAWGNADKAAAPLRSSKSYSDISTLSDADVVSSSVRARSRTPPSFYSEAAGFADGPLPLKEDHFGVSSQTSNGLASSSDDSAYEELQEDAKHFVDSITEMGFAKGQVSRAVKHLGIDEKKVVEHLCQIQVLEESGYETREAEAALHLHDYNRDQAKEFLDLVNQFQDLGFEKDAVKKALVQNKNDWNKTIDALLPSS